MESKVIEGSEMSLYYNKEMMLEQMIKGYCSCNKMERWPIIFCSLKQEQHKYVLTFIESFMLLYKTQFSLHCSLYPTSTVNVISICEAIPKLREKSVRAIN